jgi:hypothetical protein
MVQMMVTMSKSQHRQHHSSGKKRPAKRAANRNIRPLAIIDLRPLCFEMLEDRRLLSASLALA